MIESLLFYILVIILGYLVVRNMLPTQLNTMMSLGLSFGIGIGANSLIFFFLSMLGIRLSATIIASYLLIGTITFGCLMFLRKIPIFEQPGEKRIESTLFQTVLTATVVCIIAVFVLLALSLSLRNGYTRADEYSYWGVASKRIYQTGSTDLRGMGFAGFEKYPLLLPITVGSASIMSGSFAENFTKIINPLAFTTFLFFLAAYFRKIGLGRFEASLMTLMFVVSGHIVTIMATSLYADIVYTSLYSSGVLLFLLFLESDDRSKGLLLTSAALLGLASWTKIEGTFICIATLLFLGAMNIFYSRTDSKMKRRAFGEGVIYFSAGAVLPLVWVAYSKLRNLGAAGWTTALFSNTRFAIFHLANIILRMSEAIFGRMNYSLVWFWVALAVVIGAIYFWRNKSIVALSGLLIMNVGYHLATYIFVFGPQESLNAASFERYTLHFLPLGLSLVAVVYLEMKKKYLGDEVGS